MSVQLLPVLDVLRDWRLGSFDRDWAAEFRDLGSPERIKEMALRTWDQHGNPRDELLLKMLRGEPIEPVTLGWDGGEWNGRRWKGRVWAGHHRRSRAGRNRGCLDQVVGHAARPDRRILGDRGVNPTCTLPGCGQPCGRPH